MCTRLRLLPLIQPCSLRCFRGNGRWRSPDMHFYSSVLRLSRLIESGVVCLVSPYLSLFITPHLHISFSSSFLLCFGFHVSVSSLLSLCSGPDVFLPLSLISLLSFFILTSPYWFTVSVSTLFVFLLSSFFMFYLSFSVTTGICDICKFFSINKTPLPYKYDDEVRCHIYYIMHCIYCMQ